jgi:CRP-like cAMP-binding protein
MARMLVQQLTRIPEFVDVPAAEMRALAARTNVLCLPANRWLVQDGRSLPDFFYLLKGSIETCHPRVRRRARGFGKLEHFYPGCISARTLKATQVLRIDAQQREFLIQTARGDDSLSAVTAEPWLEHFLSSHMMGRLPSQDWQRLLVAFQPRCFSGGSKVLQRGSPAEHCFVIESGRAVVQSEAVTLCHLGPGDFFGEDALVLDGLRNADVIALDDMRVHAIDKAVFVRVLLESLVQFVAHRVQGVSLTLGDVSSDNIHQDFVVSLSSIRAIADELDPKCTYYVEGGLRSERALCAFLLVQRGRRAYPVEGFPEGMEDPTTS